MHVRQQIYNEVKTRIQTISSSPYVFDKSAEVPTDLDAYDNGAIGLELGNENLARESHDDVLARTLEINVFIYGLDLATRENLIAETETLLADALSIDANFPMELTKIQQVIDSKAEYVVFAAMLTYQKEYRTTVSDPTAAV